MKKVLLALLLCAFLLSGCGGKDSGNLIPAETNQPDESTSDPGRPEEEPSQQSLSERIAMEVSYAEEREKEIDKEIERQQEEAATQPEMNETAEDMYRLWDDTLNAVWGLLEASLDEADMEALRKEEREWIAFKNTEVQAAGEENGGGSLQPLLEAMKAAELTKTRVYELAEYAEGM